MKKRKSLSIVILVASLLLAVMLMDTWILYTQTHNQTKQAGAAQLSSVSGKLESSISDAEALTMEMAIKAREYLSDKDELEAFIYEQKNEIISGETGAFNLFIAGSDFCIIPDFDIPEDFNATERVWYTGAVKSKGKTYISSPYQDAMTGEICYTVSVMLGDGDAVLGVDYTMEGIRMFISQMADNAVNAVIVTDEGIIAGCSEEGLVGKKLINAMPDYAGIYASAKNKDGVVTGRVRDGIFYENLFACVSGSGWYLIVGISDWELYRSAYIQLAITIVLSLALFAMIVVLYLSAVRSALKTEEALRSREEFLSNITGELAEPLNRILERSGMDNAVRIEDVEEVMTSIHSSALSLSEMMGQIMSYKSIVASSKEQSADKAGREKTVGLDKKFRTIILVILLIVMILSLYTNISSSYQWGKARMENEAYRYEYQLSEWINTQKSLLDMFVSTISTNPEMLTDYEGTVEYLKEITEQYPEISVTYMTNPSFDHTVYMSNGWEPDEDWHVEERQWYIDTLGSETGWSISAPYYDEQTGGYCLTISKIVYDANTGEFLGIFGIDFFMDKLVDILGDSYTDDGYAFLVDPEGGIINHPYGAYQMSQDQVTNVQSLAYGETRADGKTTHIFRDYDSELKIQIAARNSESNFTVYVVADAWKIYWNVVLYGMICIMAFLFCIALVYKLLTDLIRWQERTNRQLSEAADAAIAAGRAKSTFLAQMSHEIRTPINAVLGMNEMILRESDNPDIRDYAGNIQSAGRTLLSLINSILDFSKIEDGKMELVPVKYDVSSLINDLVNSISERARAKGLDFSLETDKELPCTLFGDDVRIRQVIMNLLTNAVKYTEKGKVTLKIAEKARDEKILTLFVSVRDTGIGIRDEDREKLFESFARLDEKRNRNIEGTGLGMSIVTRLLAMMGSELKVESVYGKGSEFSFELSQEIIDPEPIGDFAKRLKASTEKKEDSSFLFAKDVRVLVVDDNEMNRKVARNLMKRNGIVPDEADSGEGCIEMMRHTKYDVVFIDHMMPKMDGMETLALLKEQKLIPEGCAVIALTANAVSGARDRYLDAGFDDYLSKPIEVAQLEKKLSMWLPAGKVEWREEGAADAVPFCLPEDKGSAEKEADGILELQPEGEADGIMEFSPDEEILEFSPDEEMDGNRDGAIQNAEDLTNALKSIGLNTDAALSFCGGDISLYRELLSDYVRVFPDRKREMDECFSLEDWEWKEFEVKIHGLKGTSKTIGASALSEKALILENAAEEHDRDVIRKLYTEFIEEYREMVNIIEDILKG